MNYFYLNGLEKIGPLSFDELKQSPITDDTLLWYESLKEWTKLSHLPELKRKIFDIDETIPPPIPGEITMKEDEKLLQNDIKNKKNIILNVVLVFTSFIIIGLSLFFAYSNTSKHIENDHIVIEKIIDNFFQGKNTVCDGIFFEIFGKKRKVNRTENINNLALNKYGSQSYKIVEEFVLSDGGFIVYKMSKEGNGFVLRKITAENMIYKVGEYTNYYGYSLPSYRPSIKECYSKTFTYLRDEQKDNSYIPGFYSQIQDFEKFKSKYYYISNETNPRIGGAHWWIENDGLIYEQFAVYFKNDFWYYEIKANDNEISKKYSSNLTFGFLIGLGIVIVLNLIIYVVRKYY